MEWLFLFNGRFKLHKEGNIVKLIFEEDYKINDSISERMWVKITEINDNIFKGELGSIPFNLESLNYGDKIDFEHRHIIEIY